MALVAAAVANGGVIMRPHVADEITRRRGRQRDPTHHAEAVEDRDADPATADDDHGDMMVQVVERGTGTAAQIAGVTVAGKTGTAQT